jgi:hypothetical protein
MQIAPITHEVLLNLFPEKHWAFIHKQDSIWSLCRNLEHEYLHAQAQDDKRGVTSLRQHRLREQYWSVVDELKKLENEHYGQCAQLIKLGLYEPKQGSTHSAEATTKPQSCSRESHYKCNSEQSQWCSKCAERRREKEEIKQEREKKKKDLIRSTDEKMKELEKTHQASKEAVRQFSECMKASINACRQHMELPSCSSMTSIQLCKTSQTSDEHTNVLSMTEDSGSSILKGNGPERTQNSS